MTHKATGHDSGRVPEFNVSSNRNIFNQYTAFLVMYGQLEN
jgi:hypothetical protein